MESYADVGGLEQQVQEIKEAVELPLTHPELYEDIGIKPPKVSEMSRAYTHKVCVHIGCVSSSGRQRLLYRLQQPNSLKSSACTSSSSWRNMRVSHSSCCFRAAPCICDTPPLQGVILYGEPGTGKTLLAKAVANSTSATFLRVVGSELIQKYLGDGPKLVRELFRVADELSPSIVFIGEFSLSWLGILRL